MLLLNASSEVSFNDLNKAVRYTKRSFLNDVTRLGYGSFYANPILFKCDILKSYSIHHLSRDDAIFGGNPSKKLWFFF